ncbi:MAG: peptidylprolyl isomerase [Dehalococcoidia bacterium]|nr:peptidylprolyl isomerase [Dehalococcoidia bacterium]
MTKRRRESKPERFVSKQQRSKWEKERRLRKITAIVGIAVIVAVLSVFGLGYYSDEVRPFTRAAVKVNKQTYDVRYVIEMLKVYSQILGQSNLSDPTIVDSIADQIGRAQFLKEAAAKVGVTVKPSDVEAELKTASVPVTPERMDVQTYSMLLDKLKTDYFKPRIPANQPQVQVQAMLLESQDAANKAIARLSAGETFDKLADELSRDATTKSSKGDLGWVTAHDVDLKLNSTKFGDAAFAATKGAVSGPVYDDTVSKDFGYWVYKMLEKTDASADGTTPKKIHYSGILTASAQDAQTVIDKLKSGSDFDAVSKELNQTSGAQSDGFTPDLGWLTFADTLTDGQKALFDLPVDGISGIVGNNEQATKGGYWVIQVLDRDDNRAMTDDQMNALVGEQLNEWSDGLSNDPANKVENLMSDDTKFFVLIKASS